MSDTFDLFENKTMITSKSEATKYQIAISLNFGNNFENFCVYSMSLFEVIA